MLKATTPTTPAALSREGGARLLAAGGRGLTPGAPHCPDPSLRAAAFSVALALALAPMAALAAGCANGADSTPGGGSAAATRAEVVASHSAGAAVDAALGEVHLRPEQQDRVAKLRVALRAQGIALREAKENLRGGLAAEVRARDGAVNKAALAPLLDAVSAAVTRDASVVQGALDDLHATLDAAQRTELTRALRSTGGTAETQTPYADPLSEIGATAEQQAAIRKGLSNLKPDRPAASPPRGRFVRPVDAVAGAFEGESFDATALTLSPRSPEATRGDAEMMVAIVAVAAPILDARQRGALVDKVVARWRTE